MSLPARQDGYSNIRVRGNEYVPIEIYENVVGIFQGKLQEHVAALNKIDAILRELKAWNAADAASRQGAGWNGSELV